MQRKEKEQRERERKEEKEKREVVGSGGMQDAMAARLAAMYGLPGDVPPTPTTPTPAYADSQKQAGVVVVSGDAAEEESKSSTMSAVVGSG